MGVHLHGKVVKQPVAVGSKSDHVAVLLETADGTFKLRRRGGNPFVDPVLEKLVGSEISGTGDVTHNQFIMADWTVTSSD
jgi:hypothetical protein